MNYASLYLKRNEDRRLRQGHLWIYSNEIDTARSPLKAFEPGQPVVVCADNGKPMGLGYINPHSLICVRLVSRDTSHALDKSLIVHRLNIALALRERRYAEPFYRLIYGESDGLPGLVVDRFGDVLVAQINTAGMERLREAVLEALIQVLKPRAIVLRNDSGARELEGLTGGVETVYGEVNDAVPISENGARFSVPVLTGQKTGWFFDHRDNRERLLRYVRGKRVLDVFSYLGAWGIEAALAGAEQVVCVDSSASAIDRCHAHATDNGVADKVETILGDAFDALGALRTEGEHFDVVVVDPPAFIKRKKDAKAGIEAYRRINQKAMQLLGRDGLLVSASCSHHLPRDELMTQLQRAGRHVDRQVQVFEQGHQAVDHPVHPAIPETEYLKCLFARVVMW